MGLRVDTAFYAHAFVHGQVQALPVDTCDIAFGVAELRRAGQSTSRSEQRQAFRRMNKLVPAIFFFPNRFKAWLEKTLEDHVLEVIDCLVPASNP